MKKRICVAVGVFLVFAALVFPQAAVDLHLLLAREPGVTFRPDAGWRAVLEGGNPLKFYLFFLACWALLLVWAIVSSACIRYRSGMIRVTPEIQTPQAAGQGQFGTARWAGPKDLRRCYAAAAVRGPMLKDLKNAGKADFAEVENASVKIK